MFDLEPLSNDAVDPALAKAERYRFLRDTRLARRSRRHRDPAVDVRLPMLR